MINVYKSQVPIFFTWCNSP